MSRFIFVGILLGCLFSVVLQSAFELPTLGAKGVLVDFDAFYIVGNLYWSGGVEQAYDLEIMSRIQRDLVGSDGFMPWTYPPQFNLLTLGLPLFERGLAFVLFTYATMIFFVLVLARLAHEGFFATILLLAPSIFVTATIGQNAFLTGGLMGLFCLLSLRQSSAAGWALGALVIKPHLGLGLGVYALATKRWKVLGLAVAIALVSSLVSTLVFGAGIWGAFLDAVSNSGALLQAGFYPLFRMMSVYAALHTLGIAPGIAIWVQIGVAVSVCVGIALAARSAMPRHYVLAMGCFGSALISPYIYDYDMTTAGVGVALLMRDILARTNLFERVVLLLLVWVAGGWGLYHALPAAGLPWEEQAAVFRATFSYGAVAYLIALALTAYILRRPLPNAAGMSP